MRCTKPDSLRVMQWTTLLILAATGAVILARYATGETFWTLSGTAVPQWVMLTLSLMAILRYIDMHRTWDTWVTLVETQRQVAYQAQIYPESVFPTQGHHTIKDIETHEVLVTNDPSVRDQNPVLFHREPWRYVSPHQAAA